jgi:integrase
MRKPKGTAKKILFRGKPKYQARFICTKNGKRIEMKRLFDSAHDARMQLAEWQVGYKNDTQVEKSPDKKTFAEAAKEYASVHLVPAVYIGDEKVAGRDSLTTPKAYLKTLVAHFGKYQLRHISRQRIQEFKLIRATTPTVHGKQRSVRSLNIELELLRTILNYCVANGWLDKTPFMGSTLTGHKLIEKAKENRRDRVMTDDEEQRLLSVCTGERAHLRGLIILAVDTGLRRGELLKLEWSMVDFPARMLRLPGRITKTKKPRTIALTRRAYDELSRLDASCPEGQSLVFGIRDNFKRSWATAKRLAGVGGLNFHDLRHSFITRANESGLSRDVVTKASGHSTLDAYERYVHAPDHILRQIAESLDARQEQQMSRLDSVLIN